MIVVKKDLFEVELLKSTIEHREQIIVGRRIAAMVVRATILNLVAKDSRKER